MTVIVVERATPGLRGYLTRWLIEVKAGVFVGKVSGRVREKLWERVCRRNLGGRSVLIYRTRSDQGFEVRGFGDATREIVDFDGLKLVRRKNSAKKSESTQKE